jgi:sialate O-acetylesterase
MRWRSVSLCLALALLPVAARADVKPHALCSDGMVLQQNTLISIWGTADKGEKVEVSFRGRQASATANDEGRWLVRLDSGAAGGPLDMTIRGNNQLEYRNVLVGEVWVCSGQSNMEWSIKQCGGDDSKLARSAEHNPLLRMFTVKRNPQATPQTEVAGSWVEAKPETVDLFSAVGYFFGRELQSDLKVPVGMIHTSWGGTRAEAWTRKDVLLGDPVLKAREEGVYKQVEDAAQAGKAPQQNAPSALYNGMIAPLLNCKFRGAIWYQGESNASRAYEYRTLFPMMIENWRRDFQQGDFPFYFVQLAPFLPIAKAPGESSWAELREAQALTLKLPNTGMAVITDLGHELDIHPTPKSPVGQRLALIAEAKVYGKKVEYSGPTLRGHQRDGERMVLDFAHAEGGLISRELVSTDPRKDKNGAIGHAWRASQSTAAPLLGFTVCGKDGKFHEAKAEIRGSSVEVSCAAVPEPMAVRYGWADHPLCNLFNRAGLPASPFRTDTFPGKTQPMP